jgi:hypothetical protein
MTGRIKKIKACLNGGRSRENHPAVPVTPAELAAGAVAAVAAEAEAVHLHPRSGGGGESLLAADVGMAVAAVRRACPGLPVGVSTGLWITDGDRRPGARRWQGGPICRDPPGRTSPRSICPSRTRLILPKCCVQREWPQRLESGQ